MGFFQQDGTYAWQVLARDASSTAIGLTDRAHAFRMDLGHRLAKELQAPDRGDRP